MVRALLCFSPSFATMANAWTRNILDELDERIDNIFTKLDQFKQTTAPNIYEWCFANCERYLRCAVGQSKCEQGCGKCRITIALLACDEAIAAREGMNEHFARTGQSEEDREYDENSYW